MKKYLLFIWCCLSFQVFSESSEFSGWNDKNVTVLTNRTSGSIADTFSVEYVFPEKAVVLSYSVEDKDRYSVVLDNNKARVVFFPQPSEETHKVEGRHVFGEDLKFTVCYEGVYSEYIPQPVEVRVFSYMTKDDKFEEPVMRTGKYNLKNPRNIYMGFGCAAIVLAFLIFTGASVLFFYKKKISSIQVDKRQIINSSSNIYKLYSIANALVQEKNNTNISFNMHENAEELSSYFFSLLKGDNVDKETFEFNKKRLANLYCGFEELGVDIAEIDVVQEVEAGV
jgi:hypothetical protein